MAYKNLEEFIHRLEQEDELIRISQRVDPVLEITEITDRISKLPGGGKALLFENTGTSFPVLINALGSEKRMCMALGVDKLDEIGWQMQQILKEVGAPKHNLLDKVRLLPLLNRISAWMPRTTSRKGACQEVVIKDPDLGILPVLKCWPEDGGRFITLPLVHTIDPETGTRNVGMYRMQIFDSKSTGMHWHRHKVGARHFTAYKDKKQFIPVAVALGGDPVYTYVATAPLPDQMDEYMLAGFLRKRRVELVRCITQDIDVPADADIILEGYIDPEEPLVEEGPFGDHTGFYSLADYYPRFHVTCMTHRTNTIYPATIVGIPPMEDAFIAKATERIFLVPLQFSILPELMDMNLPAAGVAHNLAIVKIRKSYPGQAQKVMNALWGAGQMMLNKILIVVDEGVDIFDYQILGQWMTQHYRPGQDTYFSRGPLDVLDHAAHKMGFGGKLGLDATRKMPEEQDEIQSGTVIVEKTGPQNKMDDLQGIHNLNTRMLDQDMGCVIASVKEEYSLLLKELAIQLLQSLNDRRIRILMFTNAEVDVEDPEMVVWLGTNHMDPGRDCELITDGPIEGRPVLMIDGTRKKRGEKNFYRDWPNVIVMDEEIIRKVDEKWAVMGLGPLIPSPSTKFLKIKRKGGAAIEPD